MFKTGAPMDRFNTVRGLLFHAVSAFFLHTANPGLCVTRRKWSGWRAFHHVFLVLPLRLNLFSKSGHTMNRASDAVMVQLSTFPSRTVTAAVYL